MEGSQYAGEVLPQREARAKRRRRQGDPSADPTQPTGGGGGAEAAAEQPGVLTAAAPPPPPLPERAQPGASTSSGGHRQQQGDGGGGGGGGAALPRLQHIDVPEYRTCAVGTNKFEYLDHTADVQLHAWGATLAEAFANAALAMFNYMTPLEGVALDPACTRTYEAEGHDLHSLLFAFLDELLFVFATELVVCREVEVQALERGGGGGDAFRIRALGRGERFVRGRHEAGTEVKAITYSAMQILEAPGDCEVFVIVDI